MHSINIMFIALVSMIVWVKVTADETVESLCANPVIHSADRLVNGTIRLYRDNHFWELIGLPFRRGSAVGPSRNWWQNFGPVRLTSSTHTSLSGTTEGRHYFYNNTMYWTWDSNGVQTAGGQTGYHWPEFPTDGFSAVYHDGNHSRTGKPMIVAFQGIKVWYFDTSGEVWPPVPDPEGRKGYTGGQFGEHFPQDITSAFMWPSHDSEVEYYVYLFRKDQYCYRSWKLKSGRDCDEWRDNKELFGCEGYHSTSDSGRPSTGPSVDSSILYTQRSPDSGQNQEPQQIPSESGSKQLWPQIFSKLLFITILLKFIFAHYLKLLYF